MARFSATKFNDEARTSLIKGAKEVWRAVSTTLGARGRNVVIWKYHVTKVIHDGVNTAKEIIPKDPFENAGAYILKQAGQRQVKIVESGVNPMALRVGLEKGRDILVGEIKKLSTPLKTKEQKIQIATISSEDAALGKLIGETWHEAGDDGVVTLEDSVGPEAFVEHEEGMKIDSGYRVEYFVTNPENMTANVSKTRVLVTDYKLDNVQEILTLLQDFTAKKQNSLVVIAENIEGSVLASLVQTKLKGG